MVSCKNVNVDSWKITIFLETTWRKYDIIRRLFLIFLFFIFYFFFMYFSCLYYSATASNCGLLELWLDVIR